MTSEPLYSLEAEYELLRTALCSRTAALKVCSTLDESDFGNARHRIVFGAIKAVVVTGEPIPWMGLSDELRRRKQFEEIGGADYVVGLADGLYLGPETLQFHLDKVAEDGNLRWLQETCGRLAGDCQRRAGTSDELKGRLIAAIVGRQGNRSRGPVRMADVIAEEIHRLVKREAVPAMQFGISGLDRFCGGLERGEVGIIAGKPGTGKTALAHQLADEASKSWGPGLIFSLEMNRRSLVRRQFARVSNYSYREISTLTSWEPHIGTVQLSDRDVNDIALASDSLETMGRNVWIEDHVSSLDQVISTVYEKHAESSLEWIAIDYGQLVEVRTAEKRNAEVEAVTRAAKNQIAVPLDIPVWMLSSLSKKGMDSKGADMNDLAESASLQYTCGLMLYLLADEKWPEADGIAGVLGHVLKSRNDATGIWPLLFNKPRFLLADRAQDDDAPPAQERMPFND